MEAESVKKLENNKSQKGKKDWEWKRQRWKKDRKLTKDKKWKKSKEGQKIRQKDSEWEINTESKGGRKREIKTEKLIFFMLLNT